MNPDAFREALLSVMERKTHWSWQQFTTGGVSRDLLHIHMEQEYATYVRDFAVLIGRAYVQCPHEVVRGELAENLYEEETGGNCAGQPHAQLFLAYPRGLGMDMGRFEAVELLPAAAGYRAFLDQATTERGWAVATAVSTIFVEGNQYERNVLDDSAPARPEPPLEDHPLVKHYGLPLEALALTRAHRMVEGDHRSSAWRCVLDFVEPSEQPAVVEGMEEAVARWLSYREAVAEACGLVKSTP